MGGLPLKGRRGQGCPGTRREAPGCSGRGPRLPRDWPGKRQAAQGRGQGCPGTGWEAPGCSGREPSSAGPLCWSGSASGTWPRALFPRLKAHGLCTGWGQVEVPAVGPQRVHTLGHPAAWFPPPSALRDPGLCCFADASGGGTDAWQVAGTPSGNHLRRVEWTLRLTLPTAAHRPITGPDLLRLKFPTFASLQRRLTFPPADRAMWK